MKQGTACCFGRSVLRSASHLTGPRAVVCVARLWIGVLIAAVLALPNVLWQAANGFPFLELVHNDNPGNFTGSPVGFTLNQILSVNFLLAPLWLAGIIVPFFSARLARFRFLSIGFVVTAIFILITHGKRYYLAGAYPTMFALGAAACTTAASATRRVLGGAGRRERRALASARAAGTSARSFGADDRSHDPPAADRSRGHRRAAHADALRRVRLARARARRGNSVRRVTARRSRESRDLCLELRRGRSNRRLRYRSSARAQRQQPILSVGTARLRRLGRARRQRRSGEVGDDLRLGASRSRTSAPRRTRCRTSAIAQSCSAAACIRRCRSSGRASSITASRISAAPSEGCSQSVSYAGRSPLRSDCATSSNP